MVELDQLLPGSALACLTVSEQAYLADVFSRCHGFPSLVELWRLMDEQWQVHQCDPNLMDERVIAFYRHPVWLLNGLFIEQDPESLSHRRAFADWVFSQMPARVADFGGGFGGLARLIGAECPAAQVDVVEPHPHAAAIALAATSSNVSYRPTLKGPYDIVIATDVFEHVPDPIGLAAETAAELRVGGYYLMANCFQPVIQCHLPQLFHLQIGWDAAMEAMGLQPLGQVHYGRVYRRCGALDQSAARKMEALARRVFSVVRRLPKGRVKVGKVMMRLLSQPIAN
jgi:hypothetical protein